MQGMMGTASTLCHDFCINIILSCKYVYCGWYDMAHIPQQDPLSTVSVVLPHVSAIFYGVDLQFVHLLSSCCFPCRDCVPVWGLGWHTGPG